MTTKTTFSFLVSNAPPNILERIQSLPDLLKSALKAILEGEGLPEELFHSEVDFEYFNSVLHKMRDATERTVWRGIVVAKNYIVFAPKLEEDHPLVLVGIESDSGKLFTIRMQDPALQTETSIIGDDVAIAFTDDSAIHHALGYDIDAGHLSEIQISREARYRVQGDLILQTSTIIDTKQRLFEAFTLGVRNFVNIMITDFLYGILMELGYSFRLARGGFNDYELHIPLQLFVMHETGLKCTFDAIADQMLRALNKYFEAVKHEKCDSGKHFLIRDRYYGSFYIALHYDNSSRTLVVYNGILNRTKGDLPKRVKGELREAIASMQPRDFTYFIGRHKVTLKSAYSLNATYTPTIQPIFINEQTIRTNENGFLVNEESELILKHPEHSTKKITFSRPFRVSLAQMPVHQLFHMERNTIVASLQLREPRGE